MNRIGSIGSWDPYEKAFKRPSKDPNIAFKRALKYPSIFPLEGIKGPYIPYEHNWKHRELVLLALRAL